MYTPFFYALFLNFVLIGTTFSQEVAPVANPQSEINNVVEQKTIEVEWFKPELDKTKELDKAHITLKGQTLPNTNVQVSNLGVTTFDANKNISILTLKDIKVTTTLVKSNEKGEFELVLRLPYQSVQIPFEFTATDSSYSVRNYQLDLDINSERVSITSYYAEKLSELIDNKLVVYGGPVMDFSSYTQTADSISMDLNYASTSLSGILGVQYQFYKEYYLVFELIPLEFEIDTSNSNFSLSKNSFSDLRTKLGVGRPLSAQWITNIPMNLEVFYKMSSLPYFFRTGVSLTATDFVETTIHSLQVFLRGIIKLMSHGRRI